MRYEKGDFVKVINVKDESDYNICQVLSYCEESNTYKVNDLYSSRGVSLMGTIHVRLENDDTTYVQRISQDRFWAELI